MSVPTEIPNPPTVFNQTAFRGRVYGVTGSAHGIGEAAVKELAKLGASVIVLDFDRKNFKRVEADLEGMGASAFCVKGDVSDEAVLKRVIRAAHRKWGRIDGWVNNAMFNPGYEPDSMPMRDLTRTWEVNIKAAWVAIGLLAPIMKAQGGGSIVNMSSIMAHLPQAGNAAYSMAKAALEGLTRNVAIDYAPFHIRVNAVIPGSINTHRDRRKFKIPASVPPGVVKKGLELRKRFREWNWRLGQPWPERGEARDAADVILFLLSDASRFVTGACIPVDGGAGSSRPWVWSMNVREVVRDMDAFRVLMKKYPALRKRLFRHRPRKKNRGWK